MEHPAFAFVIDYLSDLHMNCIITTDTTITLASLDLGLRNGILKMNEPAPSGIKPQKHTIYHITDYYECTYSFFQFPNEKKFLFVGPYLSKSFDDSDIYHLMDALHIPEELFSQLQNYYYALPLLTDKNTLLPLLRRLYAAAFSVSSPASEYLDLKDFEKQETFLKKHQFRIPEDPVLGMHLLEDRYHLEDDLLAAVSHGNTKKALSLAESMSIFRLAPRTIDALRNRKNLVITCNTLLRRTAYEAGVHPFYIDAVSGNYARMIELCDSADEIDEIVPYMIRSYCKPFCQRAVPKHKLPFLPVQKGGRHDAYGLCKQKPDCIRQKTVKEHHALHTGCRRFVRYSRYPLFYTYLPPRDGNVPARLPDSRLLARTRGADWSRINSIKRAVHKHKNRIRLCRILRARAVLFTANFFSARCASCPAGLFYSIGIITFTLYSNTVFPIE